MKISIEPNRNVQLCSYGLIASGYDLYDRQDAQVVAVVKLIHERFSADTAVKPYFAEARSGQIAVNPYWPKGSGVVTAALFVDASSGQIAFSEYLAHERQAASNAVWQAQAYQQWIKRLPEMIAALDAMNLHDVDAALDAIFAERSISFQASLDAAAALLNTFLDDRISIDALVYTPNVLLAPELTDFVQRGKQLYVLATEPRLNSMIHELLHYALHDALAALPETRLVPLLALADLKRLQALGYAWDTSAASQRRIVEESLVRCMTALLESADEGVRAAALERLRQAGFIVPDALRALTQAAHPLTLKKTQALIAAL